MLRHRSPDHGNTAVKERDASPAEAPAPPAQEPRAVGADDWLIDDTNVVWATPPATEARPVAAPSTVDTVRPKREYTWGQVLILLAGAAAFVFGIGAVALGGLAGSVTSPVVEVFTFDHTPLLGLIEIGVGAVLVLTGLVRGGRWIAGPVAVGTIVGGALTFAEVEWIQTELAADQQFGWVPVIVGSVAFLGAMVPAKKRRPRPVDAAPVSA
jgi:MFS family permease